jgi:ribosomal protein S12 methylthiotransferase accessory factor
MLELVSERVGIVRNISQVARGLEEPKPPVVYQAVLANFDMRKGDPLERSAAGKGETESQAIAGALGEAVERYCSSLFDAGSFLRSTIPEIPSHAIHPAECVLYSEDQYAQKNFPYVRPNEETKYAWVTAQELTAGREVYLPASLVYLSYVGDRENELFTPPTSNGLAAGPDLTRAVLSAIYEVVERDAFLMTWMNRLPAPIVDYRSAGGLMESIRTHYGRFGIEAQVFNLTTDIPIYVMMCLAIDRSRKGPAAVAGLGTGLDPRTAVEKALMEVCQVRPGEVLRFIQRVPKDKLTSYEQVESLQDHSGFFFDVERLDELSFLLGSGRTQSIEALPDLSQGSPEADVDRCVEALRGAGSRVAYVDLTTPDVKDFGVRVARVVATQLQPIHFGHGQERLGGRRLFELPRVLGHDERNREPSDLNPCPHPLA